VLLDANCSEIDPQELQSMEEKAVQNLMQKIGETVFWGPDHEVPLLRFDNWAGEYVRMEDGEQLVDEIDQQEGWASKEVTIYVELVDLNHDSKVGYVPSKMAEQMVDDQWVAQQQIVPMVTDPTVLGEEIWARKVVVDWNVVELNGSTDLVIAPISDIAMATMFGIPVDDRNKEKDDNSLPADGNTNATTENVDQEELMREAVDDVDDADDNELVSL
jgi:hypothetical protein